MVNFFSFLYLTCIQSLPPDFMQRHLSNPEDNRAPVSDTTGDKSATPHATLSPLLREWAKVKLSSGSWEDALFSAAGVSICLCSCICRDTTVHLFAVQTLPSGDLSGHM